MAGIPRRDSLVGLCEQWLLADPDDIATLRYLWLPVVIDRETEQSKLNYRAEKDPFIPHFLMISGRFSELTQTPWSPTARSRNGACIPG